MSSAPAEAPLSASSAGRRRVLSLGASGLLLAGMLLAVSRRPRCCRA